MTCYFFNLSIQRVLSVTLSHSVTAAVGTLFDKAEYSGSSETIQTTSTFTYRICTNVENSEDRELFVLLLLLCKPLFDFTVHACLYIQEWSVQMAEFVHM